jgi:hypothetical protein
MSLAQTLKAIPLLVLASHGHPAADDLRRVTPSRESAHDIAVQTALNSSSFDPKYILCPVLAAMWNGGDLKADEGGSVELQEMQDALTNGIGCASSLAKFQATGIADFDRANKETELVRDRCIPGITVSGTACAAKRAVGSTSDSVMRWLNIFTMNGKQTMEHGISTGVRGGDTNAPDPEECQGVYPCETRFQRFYGDNADSNGRLYRANLMKVVCTARKYGDRGGEYSYSSGSIHLPGGGDLLPVPAREWQMKAAIQGWLDAFGRKDQDGHWYLTIDDARAMIMEGRYPDGWKKRNWGCLLHGCDDTFITQTNAKVECDVGEKDAWWGGAGLQIATGEKCHLWCNGGATCVEGKCICGRGSNGVGMIVKGGKCVDRLYKCTYFGKTCELIKATNPTAPGNPKVEAIIV